MIENNPNSTDQVKHSIFNIPNSNLNPKLTNFLTICTNGLGRKLTPMEIEFCKRGYAINVISRRGFCYDDMKENVCKSYGSYQQVKNNLKSLLQLVIRSNQGFYQFKCLIIDQKLTERYTDLNPTQRVHDELDIRLAIVNHEQPKMHNIRINFQADGLYQNLVKNYSKPPDPQNKIYHLDYNIDNYDVKVSVRTTDSVTVNIACTYSPIVYTVSGFARLCYILGHVSACLNFDARCQNIMQPIELWRFSYFDFNKDSYSFDCDYPLHDVFKHAQMYTKTMPDNTTVFRVEEQSHPETLVVDEMLTPRFQKASELFS